MIDNLSAQVYYLSHDHTSLYGRSRPLRSQPGHRPCLRLVPGRRRANHLRPRAWIRRHTRYVSALLGADAGGMRSTQPQQRKRSELMTVTITANEKSNPAGKLA